jgi:hypothetical protein
MPLNGGKGKTPRRQGKRETKFYAPEATSASKPSAAVTNDTKGLLLEDEASAWQPCHEQGRPRVVAVREDEVNTPLL